MTHNTATCPECAAELLLTPGTLAHELITCPDCGTELEVLSLNPLELDYAPELQEDWGE
jgi:alpha-aminoadipate/glutamate carrier protein LysW